MREWEEKAGRDRGRKEFSMFIYNILPKLDRFGESFKGLEEYVTPTPLSGKPVEQEPDLALCIVGEKYEATKSIIMINNAFVRGRRINVCMAKFEKGKGKGRKHHLTPSKLSLIISNYQEDLRVRSFTHKKPTKKQRRSPRIVHPTGELNTDFVDWLSRSLVYTSEEPRDLEALASVLN
ncbi:LOW QUALITY PROTEIN: hypothetical protein Cgig2_006317 [Carnegiea gigantea]|uniref:Uncharacterized protein n=1 Tax=Carnegiea gigantea TaxID=171969 RepID=A0A9Q1GSM6_9CARY|nr:LOW QUALITY PROTEIN: hypothetical protein Cgig2_006317 [Carnegiea gigantea]